MTGFLTTWTAEEREIVRKFWHTSSATFIGEKIGRSRNAVIGAAHRMGLPKKMPGKKKAGSVEDKMVKPCPETFISAARSPLIAKNFKTCQFINGEPKYRQFCGQPVERGSYCKAHADRCYVGLSKKQDGHPPDWSLKISSGRL